MNFPVPSVGGLFGLIRPPTTGKSASAAHLSVCHYGRVTRRSQLLAATVRHVDDLERQLSEIVGAADMQWPPRTRRLGRASAHSTPREIGSWLSEHRPGSGLIVRVDAGEAANVASEVTTSGFTGLLWLVCADLDVLTALRRDGSLAVMIHRVDRREIGSRLERHLSGLRDLGIDGISMGPGEWAKGTAALCHRFSRLAHGQPVPQRRMVTEFLSMELDVVTDASGS